MSTTTNHAAHSAPTSTPPSPGPCFGCTLVSAVTFGGLSGMAFLQAAKLTPALWARRWMLGGIGV
ncbi:hypothetical protein H4R34_006368, partial [Dimargaris verticillata]